VCEKTAFHIFGALPNNPSCCNYSAVMGRLTGPWQFRPPLWFPTFSRLTPKYV